MRKLDESALAPALGWRRFTAGVAAMAAGATMVITGATVLLEPVAPAYVDTGVVRQVAGAPR